MLPSCAIANRSSGCSTSNSTRRWSTSVRRQFRSFCAVAVINDMKTHSRTRSQAIMCVCVHVFSSAIVALRSALLTRLMGWYTQHSRARELQRRRIDRTDHVCVCVQFVRSRHAHCSEPCVDYAQNSLHITKPPRPRPPRCTRNQLHACVLIRRTLSNALIAARSRRVCIRTSNTFRWA